MVARERSSLPEDRKPLLQVQDGIVLNPIILLIYYFFIRFFFFSFVWWKKIKRHFSSNIFFLCELKIFLFWQLCLLKPSLKFILKWYYNIWKKSISFYQNVFLQYCVQKYFVWRGPEDYFFVKEFFPKTLETQQNLTNVSADARVLTQTTQAHIN